MAAAFLRSPKQSEHLCADTSSTSGFLHQGHAFSALTACEAVDTLTKAGHRIS